MGVSNDHVIAAEALVVSVTLVVAFRAAEQAHIMLLGGIVMYTFALASLRTIFGLESFPDIKIVRDFAIPLAFFLLGLRAQHIKDADFIVKVAALLVLAVALFEYFFVDLFLRLFNIARYYIARGTIESAQALQSSTLFVSGLRPAGFDGGRNLLPFLGEHRVSSLFLEPVSLGNFGIILFMWGLVRAKTEGTLQIGLIAISLTLIVLGDSRFGAYFCGIALLAALLPQGLTRLGMWLLPWAALLLLALLPLVVTGSYDPQHRYVDNGFVGRLVLSAQMLGTFDVLTWFGLKPPPMQPFDSGYAYIIAAIGITGVAGIWYVLMSVGTQRVQFDRLRNLTAAYYAVILCVSNSPFTIKTASLLWFLLGALWASDGANGHRVARLRQRPA
jgi:putative polymerase